MKLRFSGNHYHGGRYRFTEPGLYDVEDEKAKQLLEDYPDQFEAAEVAQNESNDAEQTKSPSKMNKDELLALAGDVGADVDEDMTNKQLQEAIKAKQEG